MEREIYRDKLAQAAEMLRQEGIDLWMLFVRETGTLTDPSLPLLCDLGFTWETAVLVSADGEHEVVAGLHDCDSVRDSGLFATVTAYTEGMTAPLRATLARRDPRRIALNYSESNAAADGLTHGMWLRLRAMLACTPYAARLESAEGFSSVWRATKTASELALMRTALEEAEQIWAATGAFLRAGQSEREVAAFMQTEAARRGLGLAWEADHCPIVNTGPESPVGHGRPGDRVIEPGHLVHIDFGVRHGDYCTDQQRVWYCPAAGEAGIPADAQRAFDSVARAIQAAAAGLRPGMRGWEVDAIGRRSITEAGYPEYPHALGHTVGRTTHDGGPLLGPRWERYGTTPDAPIAPGQVFTLELEASAPAGLVGLEEEILVTADGCEFLSPPQTALMIIEA
jgi:Xaa-Pro aminopeptidase